jgi:hypothetical protein
VTNRYQFVDEHIGPFVTWAESAGWTVQISDSDLMPPPFFATRYTPLPRSYAEFLRKIAVLVTPDARAWFNCSAEFSGTSDCAFAWNEWELICLASVATEGEAERVRSFWSQHLPIFMSVRDEYEYYGIAVTDGSIVYGYEPLFEEPTKIAVSFTDFLALIRNGEIPQVGPPTFP